MHACSPTEPTDGAAGTLDAGHFVGSSEQQYMWHTPAVPRVYMCAFLTQHGGALKTSLKDNGSEIAVSKEPKCSIDTGTSRAFEFFRPRPALPRTAPHRNMPPSLLLLPRHA